MPILFHSGLGLRFKHVLNCGERRLVRLKSSLRALATLQHSPGGVHSVDKMKVFSSGSIEPGYLHELGCGECGLVYLHGSSSALTTLQHILGVVSRGRMKLDEELELEYTYACWTMGAPPRTRSGVCVNRCIKIPCWCEVGLSSRKFKGVYETLVASLIQSRNHHTH